MRKFVSTPVQRESDYPHIFTTMNLKLKIWSKLSHHASQQLKFYSFYSKSGHDKRQRKYNDDLITHKSQIKQNSAKAYATSLKLLAPEGATDLNFLLDTKSILQKLEKYKHTTRRNYLNAVIVVLGSKLLSEAQHKQILLCIKYFFAYKI